MNVSNTLSLNDGMTSVLQSVMNTINLTIEAMERLNQISSTELSIKANNSFAKKTIEDANSISESFMNATRSMDSFTGTMMQGLNSPFENSVNELNQFENALRETDSIISNLNKEMKIMNSSTMNDTQFKSMTNAASYLTDEMNRLQKELFDTGKYKIGDDSFNTLKSSVSSVNAELDRMASMMHSAGSYNIADGGIDRIEQELAGANSQLIRMHNNLNFVDDKQEEINKGFKHWSLNLMGVYSAIQLIGQAMGTLNRGMSFADSYKLSNARLGLANDGLQTNTELQQMIFDSANNARGDYRTTSNMVSNLALSGSSAFGKTDEIVDFSELVNKSLKISGADTVQTQAVMTQLTQALASGKLQGDELRSLQENGSFLMNMLSQGMGVQKGELKELGAEGELTAQVIVEAITKMEEEINSKFEQIPRSFGENIVLAQNILGKWTYDLYQNGGAIDYINDRFTEFVDWLGSDSGSAFLDGLETGLNIIVILISNVIDLAIMFGSAIVDNWGWIEPIVWGLVGALSAMLIIQTVSNAMKIASKIMKTYEDCTTFAAIAQKIFNGTVLANPTVWIIAAIVGAIVLLIYALTHWQEQTASVIGAVTGAFYTCWAFLYNTFIVPFYNGFAMIGEFVANIFINPVAAVKQLFYNMVIWILEQITNLATAIEGLINLIPGVEVNLTSNLEGWTEDIKNKKKQLEAEEGLVTIERLEAMDYGESFNKGYNVGYEFSMGVSDKLTGVLDKFTTFGKQEEPNFDETYSDDLFANYLDNNDVNVKVKDDVNLADESIKYLLEGATMKYINNVNLSSPAPQLVVQIAAKDGKIDYEDEAEKTFKYFGAKLAEMRESSTNVAYNT